MTVPEHDELSRALNRRARTFRRARIAVLALVVGYFFLPYDVQAWIPVWLPFLAALGLEVHFFLGGHLQARRGAPAPARDRGPQPRDIAELGGSAWRDAHRVEHEGEEHLVPTEGLDSDEEIEERVAAYLADPETTVEEAEAETPGPPYEARRATRWYVVEAVAAVALVAGILVYAARPHGWDAVSDANRARAEARFSHEATLIAGHPARITCDTSGRYVGFVQDADGLAFVGGRQAYLTPSICDTLYQLAFKHRVQSFPRTGRAIAVLAHESWHLHGVSDEGLANCYGFQSGVRLGIHLGLSERRARGMMREQLATNIADSGGNTQYVVPPGCRNGGSEDLFPAVGAFP